jgi:hypothetical protein
VKLTVVKKLPQFLSCLIHGVEENKGKILKAYIRKGSNFLHCTHLVHFLELIFQEPVGIYFFSHPQGHRVSRLQDTEVGQTKIKKINHIQGL